MYCIVSDDDGHDYVIPKDRRKDWESWVEDPESAYRELPEWADPIGGSPSLVVFPSYNIEGRR